MLTVCCFRCTRKLRWKFVTFTSMERTWHQINWECYCRTLCFCTESIWVLAYRPHIPKREHTTPSKCILFHNILMMFLIDWIFFFRFSVLNEWNFSERYAAQKNYTVDYSQHFDQLFYMFRLSTEPKLVSDESYRNLTKNTQQRRIIDEVVDFYANFAKYRWELIFFNLLLEMNMYSWSNFVEQ